MKYTKIYLDLDGVIADFNKRFIELFGLSPRSADARKEFGQYFTEFIAGKQFASLDLMPDAHTLLGYLKHTGIPVEILSSTARESSHRAISYQKELWLEKQGIVYPRNFVPGKKHKKDFADPSHIIIDDTESVIKDWKEAGGVAIHHKDALTTISVLDTLVRAG
jgi:peroxiredoxin